MGRDKTAYWEARRRAQARPRAFAPRREYPFDARVRIAGETGPACIEPILRPLGACPRARVRVIVRWEGRLARGARIDAGGRDLVVLRMFPMTERVRVAHILCAPFEDLDVQHEDEAYTDI